MDGTDLKVNLSKVTKEIDVIVNVNKAGYIRVVARS